MPSSTPGTDHVIAVAVPVPGLGVLSYRAPGRAAPPPKGARVVVPLGGRTVTGVVVDAPPGPPPETLRDVIDVLDESPFLPEVVVDLAQWVGGYYASGPGDALAVAMPPAARRGQRTAFKTERSASLAPASGSAILRGDKQRTAVDRLRDAGGSLSAAELTAFGVRSATLQSLARAGVVVLEDRVVDRDPFDVGASPGGASPWSLDRPDHAGRELTIEQQEALEQLEQAAAAGRFHTTLIQGVTGSGKTEIYLRLAATVARSGRRVLMMVPEIALTPAAAGLLRARFGERVAIQHSGLSDGERHDQWHRIRRGDVDVVVGTRSAVFAPIEGLGLIVVDEEHESSYKQDESPRYNGRDVAVVRGQREQALVVLGSATPSLESAVNARSGRYDLIRLTRRVLDRPLATVRIVDMRQEYAAHGADVVVSAPLLEAITERLSRREQTVVLLNRRGFATVIFCRECGTSIDCPHCSVVLTYHRGARRVRCHYCDYASTVPARCAKCAGTFLEQAGFGTERLESVLRAALPGARIARVDRDTVRRRGAIARVLADVERGLIDVLVGTQMIAKGHDFPEVTLVGVVSADIGLGMADFRSAERAFQLLTQVVGRAGRRDTPGEAIIQTIHPHHYSIQAAAAQDYETFFQRELEFRTSLEYPPVAALVNVLLRGRSADQTMADASDLAARVRRHRPQGRVVGPAPAALSKIKDDYRVQFFLKGRRRKPMREAIAAALAERPDLKRKTIVDVDPMSIL